MLSYRFKGTTTSYHLCITFLIFLFIFIFQAPTCKAFDIVIGTGPTDSFSYFAGKTICNSLTRQQQQMGCRLVPSTELADNLTNLQNNSLDLALVSSKSIYNAFQGISNFKYITIDYNNLRLLTPYYKSPVTLITQNNAKITSLADLKGKRINAGLPGTPAGLTLKELMSIKGWERSDFSLFESLSPDHSQDLLALKNGVVQAMLHVGMHPDKLLQNILTQGQASLVQINDPEIRQVVEDKVGFCFCNIKADTYSGLTADLTTLALETLLIGSVDTDDETVQLVLSALHKSKEKLSHVHPALLKQHVTVTTLNDSYLHPHPAALLFFQSTRSLY